MLGIDTSLRAGGGMWATVRRVAACGWMFALALGGGWAVAEKKPDRGASAADLAKAALHDDISGRPAERGANLQAALKQAPDSGLARGLAGFVRDGKAWRRFDDPAQLETNREALTEYGEMRGQQSDTVEGQLRVADWCARHKLPNQERAHLTRVLELTPDHTAARTRLGFVLVDGAWLGRDEIFSSGSRARDAAKALARWQPRMLNLRANLMSESPTVREKAVKQVAAIRDVEAIPAMELAFADAGDEAANAMIEALGYMSGPEASLALARQAVFVPWYPTGDRAASKLKSRPMDQYVPALLSAMYTPVQSRMEIYQSLDGRLMYSHAFYREGESQRELKVLTTAYTLQGIRAEAGRTASTIAESAARVRDTAVESQNRATEQLNTSIGRVLTAATGTTLPADPTAWWQWWNKYNEVYRPYPKRLNETRQYEGRTVVSPLPVFERMHECLVAGTPVWTSVGFVEIEKLKVGDLVLAQDPRSADLAYKPVLCTTVRPAEPLVEFSTGEERIRCSGGHPFWVTGKGWVKARDFKLDMVLHTADGGVRITRTGDAPAETTYNLIVADSHSYFVGESRILSHDNTVRRATAGGLPGLADAATP